jgi:uncharacterized protein
MNPAKNDFLNKRKIINDPVYGLITIPNNLVFDIIEHPWFQRLRRILQLGLTYYVYPSAGHTRYQHALGAMHLMTQAIEALRSKGILITEEEAEGAICSILLHDIGHGPYSHALEETIVRGLSHEDLSLLMMDSLNDFFDHRLDTAIKIFRNDYPKKFLHQLVSSQLDMDRIDYLSRDSFFTGVAEGVISTDRIIRMLTVVDDELVVEEKGIYSIEKFLISRRLMYWQVYLHKTVISAEYLLVNILRRVKELASEDIPLFCSPVLRIFLYSKVTIDDFLSDPKWLSEFAKLDDYDILSAIKVWTNHSDKALSWLCTCLIDRHLYKVEIQNDPFDPSYVTALKQKTANAFHLTEEETGYYIVEGVVTNNAYNPKHDRIRIKFKNQTLVDISEASDQLNISVLSAPVYKHMLCYPKNLDI